MKAFFTPGSKGRSVVQGARHRSQSPSRGRRSQSPETRWSHGVSTAAPAEDPVHASWEPTGRDSTGDPAHQRPMVLATIAAGSFAAVSGAQAPVASRGARGPPAQSPSHGGVGDLPGAINARAWIGSSNGQSAASPEALPGGGWSDPLNASGGGGGGADPISEARESLRREMVESERLMRDMTGRSAAVSDMQAHLISAQKEILHLRQALDSSTAEVQDNQAARREATAALSHSLDNLAREQAGRGRAEARADAQGAILHRLTASLAAPPLEPFPGGKARLPPSLAQGLVLLLADGRPPPGSFLEEALAPHSPHRAPLLPQEVAVLQQALAAQKQAVQRASVATLAALHEAEFWKSRVEEMEERISQMTRTADPARAPPSQAALSPPPPAPLSATAASSAPWLDTANTIPTPAAPAGDQKARTWFPAEQASPSREQHETDTRAADRTALSALQHWLGPLAAPPSPPPHPAPTPPHPAVPAAPADNRQPSAAQPVQLARQSSLRRDPGSGGGGPAPDHWSVSWPSVESPGTPLRFLEESSDSVLLPGEGATAEGAPPAPPGDWEPSFPGADGQPFEPIEKGNPYGNGNPYHTSLFAMLAGHRNTPLSPRPAAPAAPASARRGTAGNAGTPRRAAAPDLAAFIAASTHVSAPGNLPQAHASREGAHTSPGRGAANAAQDVPQGTAAPPARGEPRLTPAGTVALSEPRAGRALPLLPEGFSAPLLPPIDRHSVGDNPRVAPRLVASASLASSESASRFLPRSGSAESVPLSSVSSGSTGNSIHPQQHGTYGVREGAQKFSFRRGQIETHVMKGEDALSGVAPLSSNNHPPRKGEEAAASHLAGNNHPMVPPLPGNTTHPKQSATPLEEDARTASTGGTMRFNGGMLLQAHASNNGGAQSEGSSPRGVWWGGRAHGGEVTRPEAAAPGGVLHALSSGSSSGSSSRSSSGGEDEAGGGHALPPAPPQA
ncbi:hypothetical protein T484DRAFT_1834851, partial [Baffinella frigidus]